MIANRVLIGLLVFNLFATLLVFRGMEVIVERLDRPACADTARAPRVSVPAPGDGRADDTARSSTPPVATSAAEAEDGLDVEASALLQASGALPLAGATGDLDRIEAAFDADYGDAASTAELQVILQSIAAERLDYAGITPELVDCKAQACKLVLGYADPALFDGFIGQLTMALKDTGAATLYFGEPSTLGGYSRVELFLMREGDQEAQGV